MTAKLAIIYSRSLQNVNMLEMNYCNGKILFKIKWTRYNLANEKIAIK